MLKSSPLNIAINLGGVAAILVVGVYALQSLLYTETLPPCTTAYPPSMQLSLRNDQGAPMTPGELQGGLGREEWGVLDNVRIVKDEGGASELLEVRLPKGTSSAYQSRVPKGGAGFTWSPGSLKDATAACLSYRARLPKAFDFGNAGILPGLRGGAFNTAGSAGFKSFPVWGDEGAGAMLTIHTEGGKSSSRERHVADFTFPREAWVQVASEVVLNDPGQKNGILRLWIDGDIKIDRSDVVWRNDSKTTITGVAATVSYGGFDNASAAAKDTNIRLSPFELSWR